VITSDQHVFIDIFMRFSWPVFPHSGNGKIPKILQMKATCHYGDCAWHYKQCKH